MYSWRQFQCLVCLVVHLGTVDCLVGKFYSWEQFDCLAWLVVQLGTVRLFSLVSCTVGNSLVNCTFRDNLIV